MYAKISFLIGSVNSFFSCCFSPSPRPHQLSPLPRPLFLEYSPALPLPAFFLGKTFVLEYLVDYPSNSLSSSTLSVDNKPFIRITLAASQ